MWESLVLRPTPTLCFGRATRKYKANRTGRKIASINCSNKHRFVNAFVFMAQRLPLSKGSTEGYTFYQQYGLREFLSGRNENSLKGKNDDEKMV